MCVMFLHYILDERPKLPGIKLLHSPTFQFQSLQPAIVMTLHVQQQ